MFDNDTDTQVFDQQNSDTVDNTSADQDQDNQQQDEFFLTVNDRTKYRTKEDAVKAYSEAGQRIAQLSPWEKVSKEYGGLTPDQTRQLLQELVQLRKGKTEPPAKAASDEGGEQLTPQQKEVVNFLKKNGFITKTEAEELRKKIESLENGTKEIQSKSQEQVQNARIEFGRSVLRQQLVEDKLIPAKFANDDEKGKATRFARHVESAIADYLGEDEERMARFNEGGEEAKAVILEAYKEVADAFGFKDRVTVANSLANDKKQVLSRNSGSLPTSRSQSSGKPAPKAGKGLTPEVHNKARELFERITQGGGEE